MKDTNLLEQLEVFRSVLKKVWSEKTSFVSNWSDEISSSGQEDVTVLLVQKYFGGNIKRIVDSKFGLYNELNGVLYDLSSHYPYIIDNNYLLEEITSDELLEDNFEYNIEERYNNLLEGVKKLIIKGLEKDIYVKDYINIETCLNLLITIRNNDNINKKKYMIIIKYLRKKLNCLRNNHKMVNRYYDYTHNEDIKVYSKV